MPYLNTHALVKQLGSRLLTVLLLFLLAATARAAGIENGRFDISDQGAADFGWSLEGPVSVTNGQAVLSEGGYNQARLSQEFELAADINGLRITFTALDLADNAKGIPVDAFEVSLLDTMGTPTESDDTSLVTVAPTLSGTDAFFNLQQTGVVHFGPQVTVPGAGTSGSAWMPNMPVTIDIDLTGITEAKQVRIYFDLLGFGADSSSVHIDTVRLIGPPPTTVADNVDTAEDTPVAIDVLANDYDTDGTIDPTTVTITGQPSHGTAEPDPLSGIITYTPTANFYGSDSFSYGVNDIDATVIDPALVSITVSPVNDAPTITSSPLITIDEDTVYSYTLTAEDVDPDDTITLSMLVNPLWLTFDAATGILSGVPTNDDVGTHAVVLRATDSTVQIDQSFTITVINVNDRPIITGQNSLSLDEDTSITITLSDLLVTDPDNIFPGLFTFAIQNGANYSLAASTITPAADYNGILTVPVTVNDGLDDSDPFNLAVTVNPVNDPPVADSGPAQRVVELSQVTLNGSGSHDPDNDITTYQWLQTAGTAVTLSNATAPSPTFTAPETGRGGEILSFSLTVTDSAEVQDSSTTSVAVVNWRVVGDLNDDHAVDMTDSLLALKVLSSLTAPGHDISRFVDLDGDMAIGPAEALFALQITADNRPELFVDNDGDGITEMAGDCNDNDASVHPGAVEICSDGINQDCDLGEMQCPENIDDDNDGFTEVQGDCDDTNSAIFPAAEEICGDTIDQDCSGSDLVCPEDIDDDGDGVTENEGDCNDANLFIYPGAVETCSDGIDQDCDGSDELCPGDVDVDNDGYGALIDCDDNDNTVHPGATEIPYNAKDDDCNAATPDDDFDLDGYTSAVDCDDGDNTVHTTLTGYVDSDNDTFTAGTGQQLCTDGTLPAGYQATQNSGDDCNDDDAAINPGAPEIAYNAKDDDCDAATLDDDLDQDGYLLADDCDDNDNSLHATLTGYADSDNDTFTAGAGQQLCTDGTLPAGYLAAQNPEDCDDADGDVNPDATEIVYNSKDDDCDAATLDDDLDEDGYANAVDCDDTDATVNPGEPEIPYNLKDDDCDAATLDDDLDEDGHLLADDCDDNDNTVHAILIGYADSDNDTFTAGAGQQLCTDGTLPAGYLATQNGEDCNDSDAAINPGEPETTYNLKDDDCNAATLDDDLDQDGHLLADDCNDNDNTVHAILTGYADSDNDTFTAGAGQQLCTDGTLPAGYLATQNGEDCNDSDAAINPGETETPYNFKDDDCNAATLDDDLDQDGYLLADDCNDNDNSLHTTMTGYADSDNDSFTAGAGQQLCTDGTLPAGYLATQNGEDCNDSDAAINPGATEICGDNIDQNCDGDNSIGFTAGGQELAVYYPDPVLFYVAPATDSIPTDTLEIEIWEAPGGTYPGTYAISPTDNYLDCTTCVLIYANCDGNNVCEKTFFATGGEVNVTAYGTAGSRFTGSLSNATLQEVTIDEQTLVSTPVDGGAQWCIDNYGFDVLITPGN